MAGGNLAPSQNHVTARPHGVDAHLNPKEIIRNL